MVPPINIFHVSVMGGWILGVKLKALHMLGKCSTAFPSPFVFLSFLGQSLTAIFAYFSWAGLQLAILLPPPPEKLELQVYPTMPGQVSLNICLRCLSFLTCYTEIWFQSLCYMIPRVLEWYFSVLILPSLSVSSTSSSVV
jgi:hypothetical protein